MDLIDWVSNNILPFLVILTVLVFVHELGHYLIARWNGVRVQVFSIGFGPEIFGWTDKAKTRWKFSLIPLGGYVKMFGDADASSRPDRDAGELTEEERAVAFPHKRLSQRCWIVAGGPLANFLFAIVLLAGLFMTVGQRFTPALVGEVLPESAAAESGILAGDVIVEIDGATIERFEDIQQIVRLSPGQRMDLVVLRDAVRVELVATPKVQAMVDNFGNRQEIGLLGVRGGKPEYQRYGPVTAAWRAVEETVSLSQLILKSVGQIIVGTRSADEMGGPILIAQISAQVAEYGTIAILEFMVMLSINLGLINLVPLPMLDGGHLLFYAIEAVRGRPLGERAQEYGFRIGFALVLSLMLFVTWNDLLRFDLF